MVSFFNYIRQRPVKFANYIIQRQIKFAKWIVWAKSSVLVKGFWWLYRYIFFVVHFKFCSWYSEQILKFLLKRGFFTFYDIFSAGVIYYEYFVVVLGLELFVVVVDFLTNGFPWLIIGLHCPESEPLPPVPPGWEKHYYPDLLAFNFPELPVDDPLKVSEKSISTIKVIAKLVVVAFIAGLFFVAHYKKES